MQQILEIKSRASSAVREGILKHGVSDSCGGRIGMERGWGKPMAHSDSCRQRVMEAILEDRDTEGRVANATKKILEQQNVDDDELKCLLPEEAKRKRGGRGHEQTKEQIMKERQVKALLEINMLKETKRLVKGQCNELIKGNELIRVKFPETQISRTPIAEAHGCRNDKGVEPR